MDKIQERAIYLALRGHNILITGFPGTGKSFTVIELAKQLHFRICHLLNQQTYGWLKLYHNVLVIFD
jgi:superfamily II DNA/RNA helicase